jgi:hypothetical protein
MEDDGLVGPEHGARGDAEKQGVADLAGGTGDGDTERRFHGRFTFNTEDAKGTEKVGVKEKIKLRRRLRAIILWAALNVQHSTFNAKGRQAIVYTKVAK